MVWPGLVKLTKSGKGPPVTGTGPRMNPLATAYYIQYYTRRSNGRLATCVRIAPVAASPAGRPPSIPRNSRNGSAG